MTLSKLTAQNLKNRLLRPDPAFTPEKYGQSEGHAQTSCPECGVSILPAQFGDVFKIHPIDAGKEGNGDEETGHDRKHLHNLVHLISDRRLVEVAQAGSGVTVGFQQVDHLHGVVLDVAKEGIELGVYMF